MAVSNVFLKRNCICGSIDGLHDYIPDANPNRFGMHMVSCQKCGKVFYSGQDKIVALSYTLSPATVNGNVTPPTIISKYIYLDTTCACGSDKGLYEKAVSRIKTTHVVTCLTCKIVFYAGPDYGAARKISRLNSSQVPTGIVTGHINGKVISAAPQYAHTMMEAYEANKISDVCVACGSPTKPNYTLTPFIKYCGCVEKLPKERPAQPVVEHIYDVPMATVDQISVLIAMYSAALTQEAAIKSCFPRSTKVAYFQLTRDEANELINNPMKP